MLVGSDLNLGPQEGTFMIRLGVFTLLVLAIACSPITAAPHPPLVPSTVTTSTVTPPTVTPTAAPTAQQPTRPIAGQRVLDPVTGTSVELKGQHHQWIYGGVDYPAHTVSPGDIMSTRSVSNDAGGVRRQQYTCIVYADHEVPRINLYFDKEISHIVVRNRYGESQRYVQATTTVGGGVVPVEWSTWASRVDRLRLRQTDAVRLVKAIRDGQVTEFSLDLDADRDLSAHFDVSNLIDAMSANSMSCFNPD